MGNLGDASSKHATELRQRLIEMTKDKDAPHFRVYENTRALITLASEAFPRSRGQGPNAELRDTFPVVTDVQQFLEGNATTSGNGILDPLIEVQNFQPMYKKDKKSGSIKSPVFRLLCASCMRDFPGPIVNVHTLEEKTRAHDAGSWPMWANKLRERWPLRDLAERMGLVKSIVFLIELLTL